MFVPSSECLWFRWPLTGLGIRMLFHGLGVFVFSKRTAERMIEK
ncbi:MAG TPA: 2TM domain-containing protein [Thermodesulfobacteriota bacterium]|nr:2TM domain-containing protein [Thermodesulfobacteriota bacterium]